MAAILLHLSACARAPDRPPNLLLISIDTMRADRSSTYGYDRDTTPNLSALAARGVVFERAFAQGNESLFSHATLLTGRYPSEVARPVYREYGLPATALTLPEVLKLYGYDTAAFTSGGHVIGAFGFDQGFDTFETSPGLGFGSFFDTVPMALSWIDTRTSITPWFVFLHSYDAHAPYARPDPFWHLYDAAGATDRVDALLEDPLGVELVAGDRWFRDRAPQDIRHANGRPVLDTATYTGLTGPRPDERVETLTPGELAHIDAHYDAGIAYADMFLGHLLATLEARELLDDTLVVVVSDHGEDLLDHGFVNHRTALTDSTTHVPLVVSGPGFGRGERVRGLVDARDVVPTMLAAAGAVAPAGLTGRALQEVADGDAPMLDVVFAEGVMDMASARTPRWRLVYRAPLADPSYADTLAAEAIDGGRFTLYDSEADPAETTDVLEKNLDVARDLRERMVTWRRSLKPGTFRLGPDDVSPEVRAMLQARGYWDPGGRP
jgi:arylsulfatase A-like enzyme